MQVQNSRMLRKIAKILTLLVCLVLLLLISLTLLTQTRMFKNWLRDKIAATLHQQFMGEVQLGQIKGNLITHFSISSILLTSHSDTLFYLPQLSIKLQPQRILQKEFVIKVIALESPYIHLKQLPDSAWNVTELANKKAKIETSPAVDFDWRFSLDDIQIHGAKIRIQPLQAIANLPGQIRGLDARLAMRYDASGLSVQLRDLYFQTTQPDLFVDHLFFKMNLAKNDLRLTGFTLTTSRSRISGSGDFNFSPTGQRTISMRAEPLDFADIRQWFPELAIYGAPVVTLEAVYRRDSLQAQISLQDNEQLISIRSSLQNLNETPAYHIEGTVQKLQASTWLHKPEMDLLLNGNFVINGSGMVAEKASFKATGVFNNGKVLQRPIENLKIKIQYSPSRARGEIISEGDLGRVRIQGKASDIFRLPTYVVTGQFEHIDLNKALLTDSLKTDLNFGFQIQGSGNSMENLSGALQLSVSPSQLVGAPVDTLFCLAHYRDGDFAIDTLQVNSKLGQLFLGGKISLQSENDLRFHGKLADLRWVKSRVEADTLQARGQFAGRIQGKLDSLIANSTFQLEDFTYNAIEIDSVSGHFFAIFQKDSLFGNAKAFMRKIQMATVPLDTASLFSQFTNRQSEFSLDFSRSDSIHGAVKAIFFADSLPYLLLPKAELDIKGRLWAGNQANMRIDLAPDFYRFQNIQFTSDSQSVRADGILRFQGEENFYLSMEGVDLAELNALAGGTSEIEGKLKGKFYITGTAEAPILDGQFAIDHGRFTEFFYDHWQWSIHYEQEKLSWKFNLQRSQDRNLTGDGFLPIKLSGSNTGDIFYDDRPMRIQAATGGLDLSFLQALTTDARKIKGSFVCDITIENTLKDPRPLGFLRIVNGAFEIPKLGAQYRDLQAVLTVDSAQVNIVQFQIAGGKGYLTGQGFANYDRRGIKAGLRNTDLNFSAKNFLIARHKNFAALVNGRVHVFGNFEKPKFDGAVTVLRSRIYLPAFEDSPYFDEENQAPLLKLAQKDTSKSTTPSAKEVVISNSYVDNLRGTIKIKFPRNTWFRGPELNVEIEGSLNLVKSGPEFELFGAIRVVRGTYDLYGNRFDIEKGVLTYEGGLELNPKVEIEARHIFRGMDRQKKKLKLQITGKLYNPQLKFWLDNVEIEEKNAISYILFRRSFDELTQGERSDLAQKQGFLNRNTAKNLLAGLIAAQLSRALANQLNLDVIEFQGDNDWRQATIVLGKYLTNDLFVSYRRELRLSQGDEVVPEQVIMELEITPFLFLQVTKGDPKTTGFDLIWKYEK